MSGRASASSRSPGADVDVLEHPIDDLVERRVIAANSTAISSCSVRSTPTRGSSRPGRGVAELVDHLHERVLHGDGPVPVDDERLAHRHLLPAARCPSGRPRTTSGSDLQNEGLPERSLECRAASSSVRSWLSSSRSSLWFGVALVAIPALGRRREAEWRPGGSSSSRWSGTSSPTTTHRRGVPSIPHTSASRARAEYVDCELQQPVSSTLGSVDVAPRQRPEAPYPWVSQGVRTSRGGHSEDQPSERARREESSSGVDEVPCGCGWRWILTPEPLPPLPRQHLRDRVAIPERRWRRVRRSRRCPPQR